MFASWQESDDKKAEALLCWQRSIQSTLWSSQWSQLWDLDHKEGRMPKNRCLWTVVLEKTPESSLESREIKPGNLKGDQPWIFTGRTEAKAEALAFWSSDVHRWLIGKVPVAGKDRGQKEKRASQDEIGRRHHQCNEHELGQTPGQGCIPKRLLGRPD